MTLLGTPVKDEKTIVSSDENQKGIVNHKRAAMHHEEAAKHHHDAAKFHAEGNHEKACESTIKAHGHHCLANEYQKEDVKHHVLISTKM
jgi:hypothetical protein